MIDRESTNIEAAEYLSWMDDPHALDIPGADEYDLTPIHVPADTRLRVEGYIVASDFHTPNNEDVPF